jgi:hypothetical protein
MIEDPLPRPTVSNTLTRASVRAAGGVCMTLPPVIAEAGERAAKITLEFFTARIPNPHTRRAYGRASSGSANGCKERAYGSKSSTRRR